MEIFRISSGKYASALTASGKAARWSIDGQWVLYVGSSRSLATLENVVHKSSILPEILYKVMVILISDDQNLHTNIQTTDLPSDWRDPNNSKIREIGSQWYKSSKSLILKVPSVIIPQEFNYIININHTDFNANNVSLVRVEDYFLDKRLLEKD